MEEERLDPWGSSAVKDYTRLQEEFGIQPIAPLIGRFSKPSHHISRGIDFGHRDLGRVLDAVDAHKPYAVMSGIMPTGDFHLGSKMTADDMVYFQSLSRKATVFYSIADVEAYCDNGLSFQESSKIALNNLADLLALGLDPDRTFAYLQSEEVRVMRLGTLFSRSVTNNMLKAIYGERPLGLYWSALVQVGDILMPQLEDFGGPKPVLVPVGADQDPHIRLSRDLATRFHGQFGFIPPSAIYHRLMLSLSGDSKMSKRTLESSFTLADSPLTASRRVLSAFTGGRETVEEQRRLGGQADICPVFDLYRYHFAAEDAYSKRVYDECIGGVRMCGDCKKEAASLVREFLVEHQKKRDSMMSEAKLLLARGKKDIQQRR